MTCISINTKGMRETSITIKDIKWSVYIATDGVYSKRVNEYTQATVYGDARVVIFNTSYLSKGLIRHELVHIYKSSCCVNSADLTSYQMEEVLAEVVEYHLDDIDKYSKSLLKELKLLMKEKK